MFSLFLFSLTSVDEDNGISVTSGATAPAQPRRLMLQTYQKLTKERHKPSFKWVSFIPRKKLLLFLDEHGNFTKIFYYVIRKPSLHTIFFTVYIIFEKFTLRDTFQVMNYSHRHFGPSRHFLLVNCHNYPLSM